MNYRHAFHAGNFADLFKHALLLELMEAQEDAPTPLTVIDTHAGAGVYDLSGDAALETGEGSATAELMRAEDAPEPLQRLREAVRELNGGDEARLYPGSPWLIGSKLRVWDRAIACERRPDDAAALRKALMGFPSVEVQRGNGWDLATRRVQRAPARMFVHVDPPYEATDDGALAANLVAQLLRLNTRACVAIWAPIKDLAGFDALAGHIEDAAGTHPVLVAETRLRAPNDPLRLNGCGSVVVNPPPGLEAVALVIARWVAARFGDSSGVGRVRLRA